MSDETKRVELKFHPLIERLVEDPAAPPEVTELVGYLGKSTRAGHVRVYASLDLNEYTDVPEAAVRHAEEVPDTELEHGGTRLWLDAKAEVVHEVRTTQRVEARFLEGAIAQAHLRKEPEPAVAAIPDEGEAQFGVPVTQIREQCTELCVWTPYYTCAMERCPSEVCVTRDTCAGLTCAETCPKTRCVATCLATCPRTCPRTKCPPTACANTCPRTDCGATCDGRTCPRTECVSCPRADCPARTRLCYRGGEPFGTPVTQPTACPTRCGGATCLVTCPPTRCAVTCGATCPPTRCLATCQISCVRTRCGPTCGGPTCGATCPRTRCGPSCLATCLVTRCQPTCLISCGRTCFRTCLCPQRTLACPVERTVACPIERTLACNGPEIPEIPEVGPFGAGYGGWGGYDYGGDNYGYGDDPGDYDPYGGPWYGDGEPWET